MTTDTAERPLLLTPTGDARPVEKAAVEGIADGFPPETYLWIEFWRPDGGVRIWHAWTTGGQTLGDRIDQLALSAGLDFADWLHVGDRHCEHSARGRIKVQAFALRLVLADVQAGEHSPEERREGIRRFMRAAAAETGQTPRTPTTTWLGFGPTLVNRKG
jgi:hypothetical protein